MDRLVKFKAAAKLHAKQNNIKIKDALEILAKEEGYSSWKKCKDEMDTLWYKGAYLNHWFVRHEEAKEHQNSFGGYILPYKGQYFVVERDYIVNLGLDPDHKVWERVAYDATTSNATNKLAKVFKLTSP